MSHQLTEKVYDQLQSLVGLVWFCQLKTNPASLVQARFLKFTFSGPQNSVVV